MLLVEVDHDGSLNVEDARNDLNFYSLKQKETAHVDDHEGKNPEPKRERGAEKHDTHEFHHRLRERRLCGLLSSRRHIILS